MAADKMIGLGYVEGEPDITKMRPLWQDVWMLFAGNDITPVFDIIEAVKMYLLGRSVDAKRAMPIDVMQSAVSAALESKRMADAPALYLTPIGWTAAEFHKNGHGSLPDAQQISANIAQHSIQAAMLVTGFYNGEAYLFDIYGYGDGRGIPHRWDVPGFQAIGSGSTVANFMMFYRGLSPRTTAREALYYVLEAKYYGEQATGVGSRTDLFLAQPGKDLLSLNDEETIEEKLIPICQRLEPADLRKRERDTLNGLEELKGFPEIEEPQDKSKKAKPSIMHTISQKSKG
jgi:hypothetical protein